MSAADIKKNLLEGLGKATLRGVRKCPKCGIFNGTRGVSCKNKQCDAVFKEAEQKIKKSVGADAIKVVTESTNQLYSVRVRDRGPDYRGFVELPLIQELDNASTCDDPNQASAIVSATGEIIITHTAAKCYICKKTNSNMNDEACWHIKAAMNCFVEAVPLTLKNSALETLSISYEIKQAIWCLATESTGPLVQRVSKNVMVVKGKSHPKCNLGFLHFSFFEPSKRQHGTEPRFHCSCKEFKSGNRVPNKVESNGIVTRLESLKRCVHYYSCICAFASDEKLSEEFLSYINFSSDVVITPDTRLLALYSDNDGGDVKVEVVPSTEQVTLLSSESTELISSITEDNSELIQAAKRHKGEEIVTFVGEAPGQTNKNILFALLANSEKPVKVQKPLPVSKKSSNIQSAVKKTCADFFGQRLAFDKVDHVDVINNDFLIVIIIIFFAGTAVIDESAASITFEQWLASVTERINQTMHYQFSGNPEPLVFHSPQSFFECLQQRISTGFKKKRLPNSTTAFIRKDALPLGTFTKYSWQITNILHVKQIFDTQEMPLQITRSFVQNRDGTYDLYVPQDNEESNSFRKTGNNPPIKPFELKTYLRVGHLSPDQKDPIPFIIEWIPDILPKMKIGELRINFEYGHQRNGQMEVRDTSQDRETHFIQVEQV
ncbi:hypothetical protein GQR58_026224 [Nymphon striatum]|nr:hypothetical protein GQR58_026224 [Nymphon striatum]